MLSVVIAACGYPPLDSGSGADGNRPITGDGRQNSGLNPCGTPTSYGTPSLTSQTGMYFTASGEPDTVAYDGQMSLGSPADFLLLGFVGISGGPYGHGFTTATIPLTGNQLSFSTCDACVSVVSHCTNCSNIAIDPSQIDGVQYFATGGTIALTSIDAGVHNITGTLSNVTLAHVTFNANGDAIPVNDGCTTSITSASFATSVQ